MIAGPALLAAVLAVIGLSARSLGFDEGATLPPETAEAPPYPLL